MDRQPTSPATPQSPPTGRSAPTGHPVIAPPTVGVPATDARRVLLLVNESAGSARRKQIADEAAAALVAEGFETQRVGDSTRLAEAVRRAGDGLRCVVALGGDGTFAEALNRTPPGTPLAVLPLGTENLMAGYLLHTRRVSDLVRLVEEGVTLRLDAGLANGRLFTLMASAGFDAEVVRRVHERRSAGGRLRNISHLAYARPILGALGRYRHPMLTVTPLDDAGEPIESLGGAWVFGVNLPRYAAGLRIAPDASGLDGRLDLCVFGRRYLMAGLWYLWHVVRNRHQRLPSVETRRVAACRIEAGDDEKIPYQLDGDPGGFLPLDLSVQPGRLTVLVSRATAQRITAPEPNQA